MGGVPGKHRKPRQMGATNLGHLPGNQRSKSPGPLETERLLSLDELRLKIEKFRQQIELSVDKRDVENQINSTLDPHLRSEPPPRNSQRLRQKELFEYLDAHVGHSRITLLSLEYARKLGIAWMVKNCPGTTETERNTVLDCALSALEGPNKADRMKEAKRNQSWWTLFRPVRSDDFGAQIADVNRLRSGRRLIGLSIPVLLVLACLVTTVAVPILFVAFHEGLVVGLFYLFSYTMVLLALYGLGNASEQVIPEK